MHPEVEELRPKLKEILYDCAVDIRATKAALYLYDPGNRFELVTEYGFKGAIRQTADFNDPVIDRCGRGRTPFFVNGLAAEPRFSELLYEASTDRLLAAPVYTRGKLIGVVDMRDKAAKAAFDTGDIPKAQKIAARIAAVFANRNVFGQRFIALSDAGEGGGTITSSLGDEPRPTVSDMAAMPQRVTPFSSASSPGLPAAGAAAAPASAPAIAIPRPTPVPPPPAPKRQDSTPAFVPRLATLIIDARTLATRIAMPPSPETLSEADVAAVRDLLKSILYVPGVAVAMFSAFGHLGGVQEVAAKSTLAEDATNFLQSKLNIWLTKRGESSGMTRSNLQTPFGIANPPIAAAQLQKVFTAPVVVDNLRGLYLTVAFQDAPDRTAHEMLAAQHGQLQITIEHSRLRAAMQSQKTRIAEKLLEPELARYPELRRHTDAVVALAERFSKFLALPQTEADTVRIAALLHDVGMRLLDYERLYRKKDLSPNELDILREHVSVGAAIVEPFLGHEIARAILCHHERVDGRGYPNELHGDDIPLASRIIQLCDAWVTMTEPDSYQPTQTPDAAFSIVTRGAGSQFDTELAHRFVEMMRR